MRHICPWVYSAIHGSQNFVDETPKRILSKLLGFGGSKNLLRWICMNPVYYHAVCHRCYFIIARVNFNRWKSAGDQVCCREQYYWHDLHFLQQNVIPLRISVCIMFIMHSWTSFQSCANESFYYSGINLKMFLTVNWKLPLTKNYCIHTYKSNQS